MRSASAPWALEEESHGTLIEQVHCKAPYQRASTVNDDVRGQRAKRSSKTGRIYVEARVSRR